jgi:hypothetical protein
MKKKSGKVDMRGKMQKCYRTFVYQCCRGTVHALSLCFIMKRMDNKLEKDAPDGSSFEAQENGWVTSTDFV